MCWVAGPLHVSVSSGLSDKRNLLCVSASMGRLVWLLLYGVMKRVTTKARICIFVCNVGCDALVFASMGVVTRAGKNSCDCECVGLHGC